MKNRKLEEDLDMFLYDDAEPGLWRKNSLPIQPEKRKNRQEILTGLALGMILLAIIILFLMY